MPFTPQDALQRAIEHREIFFDEMVDLMRQVMRGEVSPVMTAAILTGLRVKKETIGEISAAAEVMREFSTKVQVDEAYLREAILDPTAKVAAGFEKGEYAMPSFAGVLNDSQIDSLVLYIKTLK